MKYYTGVGSRETPGAVIDLMQAAAYKLARMGWTFRSGGADGADTAFEEGWWKHRSEQDVCYDANDAEIYIPWDGFNGHTRGNFAGCNTVLDDLPKHLVAQAAAMAEAIHPAWDRLKQGAQKLHTRNCFQVLGKDLATPSKFVIAYATLDKHGEPKGGTRTAIKLAEKHDVRVFNLYNEEHFNLIEEWLVR